MRNNNAARLIPLALALCVVPGRGAIAQSNNPFASLRTAPQSQANDSTHAGTHKPIGASAGTRAVTYTKDVAPILQQKCQS